MYILFQLWPSGVQWHLVLSFFCCVVVAHLCHCFLLQVWSRCLIGLISYDFFFYSICSGCFCISSGPTGHPSIQIFHHPIHSTLLPSRKGLYPFKVCFLLLLTILAVAHFSKLEVYCRDWQGPLVSHFALKMETERIWKKDKVYLPSLMMNVPDHLYAWHTFNTIV
jgi:hypothetical protein